MTAHIVGADGETAHMHTVTEYDQFRWLVKYGPDAEDLFIFECTEPRGDRQLEGAEAQLRDALTERHGTYGNRDFEVYLLGPCTKYETVTVTRVRAKP